MLTVDYDFYKSTYSGNKISEEAWPAFSRDAAAYVDKLTFGRASAPDLGGDQKQSCQMAICAAAEELQAQDAGGVVASASNDGYSETYVTANQTPGQRMRAVVGLWLDNTGLLFRGVCCPC